MSTTISIVMPVLDEEKRIRRCLEAARALPRIAEILVVDGGSTDRTREIAGEFAGLRGTGNVRILDSARGRAVQMNAGAEAASCDVILFLHADVSLPEDAAALVDQALRDPSVVAGAFRTWTVCEDETPFWAPLLRLADLRSRYSRLPYGDQAIFVRREVFFRAGGFPDQPLMEDLELSRRLRRLGRMTIISASVRVSGRRFLARPLAAFVAMNTLPLLYRMGVAPRTLSRFYPDLR
jgi:rSAM/selenodomain-associated transferase 2